MDDEFHGDNFEHFGVSDLDEYRNNVDDDLDTPNNTRTVSNVSSNQKSTKTSANVSTVQKVKRLTANLRILVVAMKLQSFNPITSDIFQKVVDDLIPNVKIKSLLSSDYKEKSFLNEIHRQLEKDFLETGLCSHLVIQIFEETSDDVCVNILSFLRNKKK